MEGGKVLICDDNQTKVVHAKRLQHQCVPGTLACQRDDGAKNINDWSHQLKFPCNQQHITNKEITNHLINTAHEIIICGAIVSVT